MLNFKIGTACVAGGSGCARKTFCGEALLATCAAFCTRVRDRGSRGYPLPPATQAKIGKEMGKVN